MATSISIPESSLYTEGGVNLHFLKQFESFLQQEDLTRTDKLFEIS